MKTFKQFIIEVWHSTIPQRSIYKQPEHFDIHVNPSKSDLHKIVHSSEAKSARGIIHGDKVYVWDAMKSDHDHVKDTLNLDSNRRNFISIGRDRYGSEYVGDGDIKHITEHPWVKSTLDKHRFFHG